jgi:transcriptional regulator with XRE-family HTH domain
MLASVPTTERLRDIGARRGQRLAAQLGEELRHARLTVGLSQARVGEAAGVSRATVGRLERGERPYPTIVTLAKVARIVGLDLVTQCYPAASRLRDRAHVRLIARFLARIPAEISCAMEAPVRPNDQRAWDALLRVGPHSIGVTAETHVRDLQALLRREHQKQLDSGVTYLFLLLADTRHNRAALADSRELLQPAFPVPMRQAMRRLAGGQEPQGDAVIRL